MLSSLSLSTLDLAIFSQSDSPASDKNVCPFDCLKRAI
jgi:hypothetical protein